MPFAPFPSHHHFYGNSKPSPVMVVVLRQPLKTSAHLEMAENDTKACQGQTAECEMSN